MKRIILFLFFILNIFSFEILAGEYILEPLGVHSYGIETNVPRKVKDICKLYFKNVIEYNNHKPMVCERPFDPKSDRFSFPEWKIISKEKAKKYAEKYLRSLVDNDILTKSRIKRGRFDFDKMLKSQKDAIEKGSVVYRQAQFDIDNDNDNDLVLKIKFSKLQCDENNIGSSPIGSGRFVILTRNDEVDYKKTRSIQYGGYTPFLVNGFTYLDMWSGMPNKNEAAIIIKETHEIGGPYGFARVPVCKFLYHE